MTDIVSKEVGDWLHEARERQGYTQVALAELVGLNRGAIIEVEAGRGSMRTIEQIGRLLNFRIAGLAGGATLAEQLMRARQARGWTQAHLAERAGVSIPSVRSAEAGRASTKTFVRALRVLAPNARPGSGTIASWHVQDDVRFTPPEFMKEVEAAFGDIDVDVAGDPKSYVRAGRVITQAEDGLSSAWRGRLAWCNPPYSRLSTWIRRCAAASEQQEVETVLGLLPARLETEAFRTRIFGVADVILLPKRLRFHAANGDRLPPAPFALVLAAWGASRDQILNFVRRTGADVIWADDVKRSRRASLEGAAPAVR